MKDNTEHPHTESGEDETEGYDTEEEEDLQINRKDAILNDKEKCYDAVLLYVYCGDHFGDSSSDLVGLPCKVKGDHYFLTEQQFKLNQAHLSEANFKFIFRDLANVDGKGLREFVIDETDEYIHVYKILTI